MPKAVQSKTKQAVKKTPYVKDALPKQKAASPKGKPKVQPHAAVQYVEEEAIEDDSSDEIPVCYHGEKARTKNTKGGPVYVCARSKDKKDEEGKWINGCWFFCRPEDVDELLYCDCNIPYKFEGWKLKRGEPANWVCYNNTCPTVDSSGDPIQEDE